MNVHLKRKAERNIIYTSPQKDGRDDFLEPVFENGALLREQTFDAVRTLAAKPLGR